MLAFSSTPPLGFDFGIILCRIERIDISAVYARPVEGLLSGDPFVSIGRCDEQRVLASLIVYRYPDECKNVTRMSQICSCNIPVIRIIRAHWSIGVFRQEYVNMVVTSHKC